MGWFSTPKTPAPPEGVAPNRSQRARCWDARDAFFECLDRNAIVDPVKHAAAATDKCPKQETAFERECVASWVEYFKKRRVMEHNRSETFRRLEAEGAKAVGMPNPVGQAQAEPRREAEQRP